MTDKDDRASRLSPIQRRLLAGGRDSVGDRKQAYDALADPKNPVVWSKVVVMLGDEDDARAWMLAPRMALDYRRPDDMLDEPSDRRELMDHIIRIAHGTYT